MADYSVTREEPTKKDYQADAYQKECVVWVDEYGRDEKGLYLIFSNTVFYPNGGGQKGDRGILILSEEISTQTGLPHEIPVIDTRKEGDSIHHYIGLDIEDEVLDEYIVGYEKFKVCIDWEYRYKQMKLHSTAHLLHCFIEKIVGAKIEYPSYSELFEDKGVNRYPVENVLTKENLEEVLRIQNEWTAYGHDIKTYKSDNPGDPDWFRWWECEEFKIPCGGIHPKNTKEIGQVGAKLKLKKDSTSITFNIN